jgi:WD40 repeat protein
MHTAMIRRIAIDATGHYLVTGSDDKTARVWSLPDGNLLRILRPPLGEGNEGKIYAVALSPDGKTVAVGGWTGTDCDKNNCSIYLFNRTTGDLQQRLTGLPNVILHLAYSTEGRYLVASLFGGEGIRIYESPSYTQVAKDTDYGDNSLWAEFDSQGRLVTSCDDGFIRLYDNNFKLLAKQTAPGGQQPYAVRFSPKGDRIAVGFADSTQVNVLSGQDLKVLYRPSTQGVDNGNLMSVAWLTDGSKQVRGLVAGGTYDDGTGMRPILHWSNAGQGVHSQWASGAFNTIMDLRVLPNGNLVFGAGDPMFGVLSAQGNQQVSPRMAETADFRWIFKGSFRLSATGDQIQFGYELGGLQPTLFSIPTRTLMPPAVSEDNLSPRTTAPGLTITDWDSTTAPKLNGKPLSLTQYERSRSLAIAPDGQQFLLGTEWYLRLFDKQGQQQWEVPVPGAAWGVNIAGNGKVAVAALADGTIRWYRLQDGQELLALFPHPDKKRWILWTPQGYYDASAGAEELIIWHVNRGPDKAADFYPVGQFRQDYYRPDILAKVLETLDVKEAVRLANLENNRKAQQLAIQSQLPPVVTLLFPETGTIFFSPKIDFRYQLRHPTNEPVTMLKVLQDGRPLPVTTTPAMTLNTEQTIAIPLPQRDVQISLIAENQFGASTPATVQLRWTNPSSTIKPKLYVLAVGVSQYDDTSIKSLNYADKDAKDFVNLWQHQGGKLYREVTVNPLINVTRKEILKGLQWIEREVTQLDVGMVFFSGHGETADNGRYYFLPRDAKADDLRTTAIPALEIQETVSRLAGKALFFIDSCHAGSVMGKKGNTTANLDQLANDLASAENGVVVFTASTGKQLSQEDAVWENGAFTEALIEGLSGKADTNQDGAIGINELNYYLTERVKKLTDGKQSPMTTMPKTIQDFPVAIVQ